MTDPIRGQQEFQVADRADERSTRAARVRQIHKDLLPDDDEPDNIEFARQLNEAAAKLKIGHAITPNRVAKLRTGAQLLQFEDVAALAAVDPGQRGWLWIVFGISEAVAQRAIGALIPQKKPSAKRVG